ncbi:GPI-Mannosyltransferase II co-activator, Pga1 [Metarhizium album ARSEF 1941]|uniref:GPI-Mannosyltransferase II co-activator, Pga1 n=1 Tax=Metarhizium album (strain ARSEF 1941) TaxID=1081103 RepID=A0A0B2WIJ4_METAS|nr:GPI-Mannosyltransferase II co-activator, Pga1 [Metarhizium album ARSEF 1941]KHN95851.1 GPI-Mannosyltransferase II co-activator, Pga1 [Metarhizium album ARSEF 1941]
MVPPTSGHTKTLVHAILLLCILVEFVAGNVEKIIFTGPPSSPTASSNPALSSLNINTLTHDELSVRTNLDRIFASEETGFRGQPSWILVTNLTENRRYEFRVCWSALEPNRFDMEAYTLETVVRDPRLLRSLNAYAASRPSVQTTKHSTIGSESRSLLVEIHSAADYFTDNAELMTRPPPILVDFILDPFLFNVLPQSLLPTVGYLSLLGIVTWFVGRWVASSLRRVADSVEISPEKQD